ncbi:MAG: dehydrogenase [Fibrobacteres bacterium]|jgi:D-glycero-alpha-D-manno-heptose-7-phosphate kinase|nr:dehydrogenase [Fibrobacterota bacterium]
MIVRSRAPLRLGLAGGGTDVSPYSDMFGGVVLNATIDLHAHCTIVEAADRISFSATDLGVRVEYPVSNFLALDGKLDLHKGVYNRIVQDFGVRPGAFRMTTYSDAPPGSGLGSSSTMVVAIVKAFVEWLGLPLGEYEIAHLAYKIERVDLGLSGGKQDQYAATFGGFNFMEFGTDGSVVVNPLRVKRWIVDELESSMILYYTGASRESASIIDEQKQNAKAGNVQAIDAMHSLKSSCIEMKASILRGEISGFARILGESWASKKRMAASISNPAIELVFDTAMAAGAVAGKISGAGGGGFAMFVVNPERRIEVVHALSNLDGKVVEFGFTEGGCHGWKIEPARSAAGE